MCVLSKYKLQVNKLVANNSLVTIYTKNYKHSFYTLF